MILPHAILVPELPLGCDVKSSGISWCYCNIRIHIYFTSKLLYDWCGENDIYEIFLKRLNKIW